MLSCANGGIESLNFTAIAPRAHGGFPPLRVAERLFRLERNLWRNFHKQYENYFSLYYLIIHY